MEKYSTKEVWLSTAKQTNRAKKFLELYEYLFEEKGSCDILIELFGSAKKAQKWIEKIKKFPKRDFHKMCEEESVSIDRNNCLKNGHEVLAWGQFQKIEFILAWEEEA